MQVWPSLCAKTTWRRSQQHARLELIKLETHCVIRQQAICITVFTACLEHSGAHCAPAILCTGVFRSQQYLGMYACRENAYQREADRQLCAASMLCKSDLHVCCRECPSPKRLVPHAFRLGVQSWYATVQSWLLLYRAGMFLCRADMLLCRAGMHACCTVHLILFAQGICAFRPRGAGLHAH